MKKFLIVIAAFASFVSPNLSYAAADPAANSINCSQIDITKYNGDQLDKVKQICAAGSNTAVDEKITPADVRQWASLGKEFSTAVIDTARGLGVTANEFLATPVGMLLALYFMWDVVGGIIIGIPLLFGIWWLYFKIVSSFNLSEIEYTYVPVLFGLFNRKKIAKYTPGPSGEYQVAMLITALPAIVLSIIDLNRFIF